MLKLHLMCPQISCEYTTKTKHIAFKSHRPYATSNACPHVTTLLHRSLKSATLHPDTPSLNHASTPNKYPSNKE